MGKGFLSVWRGYWELDPCPKCGAIVFSSHTEEQCKRWKREIRRANKKR